MEGFYAHRRVRKSFVGIRDSLHIGLVGLLDLHSSLAAVLFFLLDLHSNLAGNTLGAAEGSSAVTTGRPLPVDNNDPS